MPSALCDDSDHRMRRVEPSRPIRWSGSVGVFRALLVLQQDVLAGRIGGPNDGGSA